MAGYCDTSAVSRAGVLPQRRAEPAPLFCELLKASLAYIRCIVPAHMIVLASGAVKYVEHVIAQHMHGLADLGSCTPSGKVQSHIDFVGYFFLSVLTTAWSEDTQCIVAAPSSNVASRHARLM